MIKEKHTNIDIPDELPQWQKDILNKRKALTSLSDELISMVTFIELVEADEQQAS